MTIEEFSNGFTELINSYAFKPEFGEQRSAYEIVLNEYEKSLFLTQAQEEFVMALYNGQAIEGKSFEETEQMRRLLDSLIKTKSCDEYDGTVTDDIVDSTLRKFYLLPDEVMYITMEQVIYSSSDSCLDGLRVNVKPVTQDEYNIIKDNPFRGVTKNRALRLDCGVITTGKEPHRIVEVIPKYTIEKYIIRYLEKPEPIVLENLTDTDLSINGVNTITPCKLNPLLHRMILERAVLMALRVKGINTESK